jgi:hypothetical protein
MAKKTIEQRIQSARQRQENTLNLSFSIDDVDALCGRFQVNPKTMGVGILVKKIFERCKA